MSGETIPEDIYQLAKAVWAEADDKIIRLDAIGVIAKAIAAERERCAPAVQFSKKVLTAAFDGCDIGGFDAQDMGVECGVLKDVPFDPNRHKDPSDFCEPGDWWFEFAGPLASQEIEAAPPTPTKAREEA